MREIISAVIPVVFWAGIQRNMNNYYVYILSIKHNGTLYAGVTSRNLVEDYVFPVIPRHYRGCGIHECKTLDSRVTDPGNDKQKEQSF